MNLEQSPLYLQRPDITSPGLTSATIHVTTGHAVVLSAGKSEVYGQKAVKKGLLRLLAVRQHAREPLRGSKLRLIAFALSHMLSLLPPAHSASAAASTAKVQAA
jgi:hypothetical protein